MPDEALRFLFDAARALWGSGRTGPVAPPAGLVSDFLPVLARVAGVFTSVPIPGFRSAPAAPRVVASLAMAFALVPALRHRTALPPQIGPFLGLLAVEALVGLSIGLVVAFLNESFQLGAQVLGLQAGYAYASTVDPTSQADSGVLQVVTQLASSLLFLSLGLDRQVLVILGRSFESLPPGTAPAGLSLAESVIRVGGMVFSVGLQLAFPVIAMLVMVDLALALLGRMHGHLQLLTLAFPVKILVALAMVAVLVTVMPGLYEPMAARAFAALAGLCGG